METIYELRHDADGVAHMQRASRGSGPTGLRQTHGLIGSEEWWSHIAEGSLQLHTEQGVVSGFWPGQGGGGPAEFQLRQSNGTTSMWLCELEPGAAKRKFLLGRPALVEYVLQELKVASDGDHETKIPITIALG